MIKETQGSGDFASIQLNAGAVTNETFGVEGHYTVT